jgi:hypothetical protein
LQSLLQQPGCLIQTELLGDSETAVGEVAVAARCSPSSRWWTREAAHGGRWCGFEQGGWPRLPSAMARRRPCQGGQRYRKLPSASAANAWGPRNEPTALVILG